MNLSLQKELQRWALNIGVKEVTKFSGPTPTKQYLQTLQHVNIKKSQKLGFQSCKFTHHRNNLLDFRHPPVTTRFAKINKQDNEAKSQIDSSMNKKAPNLLNNIKICSIPLKIFGIKVPLLRHVWLKTPNLAAGLGPASGEIPLIKGNLNPPGVDTEWIDHNEANDADIQETPYNETLLHKLIGPVDSQKLEANIQKKMGVSQGPYLLPPTNNCVVAVMSVLNESK